MVSSDGPAVGHTGLKSPPPASFWYQFGCLLWAACGWSSGEKTGVLQEGLASFLRACRPWAERHRSRSAGNG